MSNNDNYGTYGRFCDFGEICKNDQCKCPDGGNVGTVSNCGYCGNYCLATPGSEVNCKNGKCVSRCSNPVNTNCGTDQVADYTSLQEDENNCGVSGKRYNLDETCSSDLCISTKLFCGCCTNPDTCPFPCTTCDRPECIECSECQAIVPQW